MNQYSQGESSGGFSIHPLKRKRGRPRKDPSLKKTQAARVPPGFEGVKELPQRVNRTEGVDIMVGQAVTGVVEATFDAGYLLTVRIGNSTMSLRGVVFKPGHFVPVTAENDVAPHLQMIRRNDVHAPAGNQGWSRSQKFAIQAGALVPSKCKYRTPQAAPTVPQVGARGTMVPVLLQPVNLQNGLPTSNSNQVPKDSSPTAHMMSFGDKDVHMVEPLAMLPPDRSVPVNQIIFGAQSNQATHGTKQTESGPISQVTVEVGQGGKTNQIESTEVDNPGSFDTSETQTDSGKEVSKSSPEDSCVVSKQETGTVSSESVQSASLTKPFFNFGTGRMTELLQAVQENMKENHVQPPSRSNDEVLAAKLIETVPKSKSNAP